MKRSHILLQSLRLMRREMRVGIRGFGVFLGCLFLGVFAISAIGNFTAAARSGLLSDASALLGGDLEIRLTHRPLTREQTTFLQPRAALSGVVELRTMAASEQTEYRGLVELKAVDDNYPLYGNILLAPRQSLAAALAPLDGIPGAAVERAFQQRFSVAVGDRIRVGKTSFRIRGILENEPDRSFRAFTLGPRVMISGSALAATGLVQPGSLVNYSYRLKLPERGQSDLLKKQLQEKFPEAGWRLRTWREAAPRVRAFLDRMETNLTLLGLCSLLVGGLGVTGAVRGYLDSKTAHIATMKCLGASKQVIFTTYLLQILLLGALGSTAGLLAGASLPWLIEWSFGSRLPLPLIPGMYPQTWIIAALFGLLTALLFSLKALGIACRVTPAILFRGYTEAENRNPGKPIQSAMALTALLLIAVAMLGSADRHLALWFIAGAGLCFLLFRVLAGSVTRLARRLPRPAHPSLRLALSNVHRPGSPAGGIIFSLGIGLTALVMIVQVQSNLSDMVNDTLPEKAPAFFFFDIQAHQIDAFKQMFASMPDITNLKYSPTLRGRITAIDGTPVEQADIDPAVRWAVRGDRFLSYTATLPQGTRLTAGTWWPEDYRGPPKISLTEDLAAGFGVGIGDNLSINILGRTMTAEIANLRAVDWATLELNFAVIFAPGILESAPQTYISSAHLPEALEEQVYRRVTETFPNVSAVSVREVLSNVSRTLSRIGWAFKGMAAIALLTGFLVLIGAVSADQHRRIRDAVIFKVCGATRRDILVAFAGEFIFLGCAAGTVSFVTGSLAALAILEGPLRADFHLHPLLVLTTLLCGILLTLLLGLLGTWKALGHKAATYLRLE